MWLLAAVDIGAVDAEFHKEFHVAEVESREVFGYLFGVRSAILFMCFGGNPW